MPSTRTQRCGCGRGVFGLIDWTTPLRRPAVLLQEGDTNGDVSTTPTKSPFSLLTPISPAYNGGSWADVADSMENGDFSCGNSLLVKYSYTANADSPLDKQELTVKQKDRVQFVSYHMNNHLWSCVRNIREEEGYVPTNYLMLIEDQMTSLPWLKQPDVQQQQAEYKPYKSAYQKPAEPEPKQSYYCDVCERSFNGPQPFAAHMKSRAHKEEVEAKMDY